jgi:hypothetical protein
MSGSTTTRIETLYNQWRLCNLWKTLHNGRRIKKEQRMKTSPSLIGGTISGSLIGIGIALIFLPLLLGATFQFDVSPAVRDFGFILGGLMVLIAVPTVGVLPVVIGRGFTYRDSAFRGIGAGLIASIIIYLIIGSLFSTLYYAIIPFVDPMAYPEKMLQIDAINEVFRPIVQNVMASTYAVILGHLFVGGLVGFMESILFVWIRSLLLKRQTVPTASPRPRG